MTHLLFKTVDFPGFFKKTEIPAAPIPPGQGLTGGEEEEEKEKEKEKEKEEKEQLRENLMTPQPDGWGKKRKAFPQKNAMFHIFVLQKARVDRTKALLSLEKKQSC